MYMYLLVKSSICFTNNVDKCLNYQHIGGNKSNDQCIGCNKLSSVHLASFEVIQPAKHNVDNYLFSAVNWSDRVQN